MASMRASVSLLRIQSISWRCVFSPAESMRRNRGSNWPVLPPPLAPRDRALRPSNSSTSSRSTNIMVSKQHLLNTAITTFIRNQGFVVTSVKPLELKRFNKQTCYNKVMHQIYCRLQFLLNIYFCHILLSILFSGFCDFLVLEQARMLKTFRQDNITNNMMTIINPSSVTDGAFQHA